MGRMMLALLLCLAGKALTIPMPEPQQLNWDDNGTDQAPFIYEYIQEANKNIVSSMLLMEGDIAVDLHRNARTCNACQWNTNNGIAQVPYFIDPKYSASDTSLINEALKEFEVMTCVKFVNRGSESDYLYIQSVPGSGCWSYIGKMSGKQTVSLESPSCMVYGVIQHEAMHNIGFFHEHTRVDRDNYIAVQWNNIITDYIRYFDIDNGNTFNLPYDYVSVMHYPMYTYAIQQNLPTIVPKPDPTVPIGQRSGMSNLDVMKINILYNCNLCRRKLMAASGSFSGASSYANQYGGNCLWLIQIKSKRILLQVYFLSISSTDYIKVYDGTTKSSPILLDKTSGSKLIRPLVSAGRNMLVEFVTAASSMSSTFQATYFSVEKNEDTSERRLRITGMENAYLLSHPLNHFIFFLP